jgi:8-oxo-dGTP pyrophosphatase MutT (NUDIX family)
MASSSTSASGGAAALADGAAATLPFTADLYGGISVHADALPPDAFAALLSASLAAWRAQGVRGVWLHIPQAQAALIPPAVAAGFSFHHTTPAQQLVLTQWLDASSPSHLPAHPSTAVGVGAFLLNARGEMLVVQERRGPAARPGLWKVPTGLVDRGEEVADAAVREVREETGVEAVFESVVGVRHAHGVAFGCDDLFFLCVLRLKGGGEGVPELVPQASEIAAAQWMRPEDFAAMPHVQDPESVWGRLHRLCMGVADGKRPPAVLVPRLLPLGVRPGSNTVFLAQHDCEA